MLDVKVAEMLNIDPFTQYIMKELDDLEDDIYSNEYSQTDLIAIKARYEQMLKVRDAYADYINNKK